MKKEEELEQVKQDNERLKKELNDKKNSMKPKPFEIDKQISFNLNVPVRIEQ